MENIISILSSKKLKEYEKEEEVDIGKMGEKEYMEFIKNSRIKRIVFKI